MAAGRMEVIKPRTWTERELRAAGFRYYERKKEVVMARPLPAAEAPKTIRTPWETLTVDAGYMICYQPGKSARRSLDEYEHWPCHPDIFQDTYRAWNTAGWKPNAAERDLMQRGCKPYYKVAGVWAKCVTEDVLVQSLESTQPARIPAGAWVAIGEKGAPYHLDDPGFRARYVIPGK